MRKAQVYNGFHNLIQFWCTKDFSLLMDANECTVLHLKSRNDHKKVRLFILAPKRPVHLFCLGEERWTWISHRLLQQSWIANGHIVPKMVPGLMEELLAGWTPQPFTQFRLVLACLNKENPDISIFHARTYNFPLRPSTYRLHSARKGDGGVGGDIVSHNTI